MSHPGRSAVALAACCVLAACGAGGPERASVDVRDIGFPGGDGSGQPRLTADVDGAVILSWLEPRDDAVALMFSRLVDGAWAEPAVIVESDALFVNWADFPSVTPIAEDLWVAHWLGLIEGTYGAYNVFTAISRDRGATWASVTQLNDDDTETEHGFADVFAWGDSVGAVWLDGRELANWSFDNPDALLGVSLRYARLDRTGAVADRGIVDDLVCDCCQPDVALTSVGPMVAYRDRTEDEIRDVVVRRHDGATWSEPEPLGDEHWLIEGCPVNGPAIAARGADVAVAWFTAADQMPRVRLARSTDGGDTFGAAMDLDTEGAYGQVDVVLDAEGRALVTWWRRAATGGIDLAARTVDRAGALGPIAIVAHESEPQPIDVPQLLYNGNVLVVAWTTFDGEGTVRTALIRNAF